MTYLQAYRNGGMVDRSHTRRGFIHSFGGVTSRSGSSWRSSVLPPFVASTYQPDQTLFVPHVARRSTHTIAVLASLWFFGWLLGQRPAALGSPQKWRNKIQKLIVGTIDWSFLSITLESMRTPRKEDQFWISETHFGARQESAATTPSLLDRPGG
jgi:hypothetical protein